MELTIEKNRVKMLGKGIFESYRLSNFLEKVVFIAFPDKKMHKRFIYNNGKFIIYCLPTTKPKIRPGFKGILSTLLDIVREYILTFFHIKKLIEQEKINLIKVENILLLGFPAFLISKYKKIPYILWIAGPELKVLEIKMAWLQYLSKIVSIIFNILAYVVVRGASVVINISPESSHLILSKKPRIYVFLKANYVDTNMFYPRPCRLRKEKYIILFVGRLEKEKGIELLIEAIEKINKRRNDFEVWIIGYGSMYDYIRENIEKKNLPIKLLGRKDIRELSNYYNCADIFIFPSLVEGPSAALLEAMACGVPVITTTGPVKNFENGILVEKNSDAIARAIMRLLDDEKLRKRLAINAVNFTRKLSERYLRIMYKLYTVAVKQMIHSHR